MTPRGLWCWLNWQFGSRRNPSDNRGRSLDVAEVKIWGNPGSTPPFQRVTACSTSLVCNTLDLHSITEISRPYRYSTLDNVIWSEFFNNKATKRGDKLSLLTLKHYEACIPICTNWNSWQITHCIYCACVTVLYSITWVVEYASLSLIPGGRYRSSDSSPLPLHIDTWAIWLLVRWTEDCAHLVSDVCHNAAFFTI